jgi:hypothetical protein
LGKEAESHVDAMIKLVRGKDFEAGAERTTFRIVGGVNDAGDACLDYGASTHSAGFESDVEGSVREAVVAKESGGFTDDNDLGMGRGIVITNSTIICTRKNFFAVNEDCTDGNLTGLGGSTCFGKSELHVMYIVWHRDDENNTMRIRLAANGQRYVASACKVQGSLTSEQGGKRLRT